MQRSSDPWYGRQGPETVLDRNLRPLSKQRLLEVNFLSNAGGCNHIYNFNIILFISVPRFNHTLYYSPLVYLGYEECGELKGNKTQRFFLKICSLTRFEF